MTDDLSPKWNAQRYGLAMPQVYAEVFCPWGNGLSMKLGHFYSILGYETRHRAGQLLLLAFLRLPVRRADHLHRAARGDQRSAISRSRPA